MHTNAPTSGNEALQVPSESSAERTLAVEPCPNCGDPMSAVPQARYCPSCGQETRLQVPTLLQFVREFFTHYGAADGALWRTLGSLLFRPGHLTRQFVAGRRRHYIGPMRLYLMCSFLFFLAAKFMGSHALEEGLPPAAQAEFAAQRAAAASAAEPGASAPPAAGTENDEDAEDGESFNPVKIDAEDKEKMEACLTHRTPCSWWETQGYKLARKAASIGHRGKALTELMLGYAPTAAFFMLPFFAALLKILYWGRRRAYGEHFVCSLHLHSFWFLSLLAITVLPSGIGKHWLFVVIPFWTCLSLRVVYGDSWVGVLVRSCVLSFAYTIVLSLGMAVLGIWAVLAV